MTKRQKIDRLHRTLYWMFISIWFITFGGMALPLMVAEIFFNNIEFIKNWKLFIKNISGPLAAYEIIFALLVLRYWRGYSMEGYPGFFTHMNTLHKEKLARKNVGARSQTQP